MSIKLRLALVEKLQKLADKYSEDIKKSPAPTGLIDSMEYLTAEGQAKFRAEHYKKVKSEIITSLEKIRTEIQNTLSADQRNRKLKLNPGLENTEDSKRMFSATERNTALLSFQVNWTPGNADILLNEIKSGIESKRYDFVSTLFEQILNSKSVLDVHDQIKLDIENIQTEYHKALGIDLIDEQLKVDDYALSLSASFEKMIERNEVTKDDSIYLPGYKTGEYSDLMVLARLSDQTGVKFAAEHFEPQPSPAVSSSAAGE